MISAIGVGNTSALPKPEYSDWDAEHCACVPSAESPFGEPWTIRLNTEIWDSHGPGVTSANE
jgi:hypothetical protein